jgi:CheY-like chemotaxis protein
VAPADPQRDAEQALHRYEQMGIRARLMDGGRCVLATIRLQPVPFEALDSTLRIENVIFASVGRDRIKCLRPRALFQLPILQVSGCSDSTAIEARIRLAWRQHVGQLEQTKAWLDSIGAVVESVEDDSLLSFTIEGESRLSRVNMIDPHRIILPTEGKLSGITLERPEDRTFHVDRSTRSSVELEIAVSTRLDELVRLDERLADERRRLQVTDEPTDVSEASQQRSGRILLVGPNMIRQRQTIDSLRLRDYQVDLATNEHEALSIFDSHSPELVMADMNLGRNDGTSLVLALRQVTGIEEIPVLLVDDARRAANKEAARLVGAAGYLVHPVEIQRIAERLTAMINAPRRRRFTRYSRRLPVLIGGADDPSLATTLSRGGMFVATDRTMRDHSLQECRLSLPEVDAAVSCKAEVVYRQGGAGRTRGGVGVRFDSFSGNGENLLIDYLHTIDQPTMGGADY